MNSRQCSAAGWISSPPFKVAAYSSTPAWLAGFFWIVPIFAFLSVVGLYGLYLGLPLLMRAPVERAWAYTAVVAGAAVGLAFVVSGVLGLWSVRASPLRSCPYR